MWFFLLTKLLVAGVWAEEQIPLEPKEKLEEQWKKLSVDEHLQLIHALQQQGNYESAEKRLEFLLREGEQDFIRFEQAKNWEYQEHYEKALQAYQELLKEKLSKDLRLNILYRYSLSLSELKQDKEAIKIAKKLRCRWGLSKSDKQAVRLMLATNRLRAGQRKKGIKGIEKWLPTLENTATHSWLQARARIALSEELLRQASLIELSGAQELNQQLQERASAIIQAEKQVQAIIQLNEPEYALTGLTKVADAMLVLYDELLSSPAPSEFTSAQEDLYREAMAQQADVLQQKALSYYSTGLRYANQLNWSGYIKDELHAKYYALQKEM